MWRAISPTADFNALLTAWNSAGGWQAAWRDTVQLLAHRRVLVDTHAQTPDGSQVVLRTRVRLDGDVQTDVLRCWLVNTPRATIEVLAKAHFDSVADVTRGWSAAHAMMRRGS